MNLMVSIYILNIVKKGKDHLTSSTDNDNF